MNVTVIFVWTNDMLETKCLNKIFVGINFTVYLPNCAVIIIVSARHKMKPVSFSVAMFVAVQN